MNNDTLVDIVLASYNGELYIEEQINSILEQTHKNIRLIVTDDGSSDNTQKIVKEIMEKDSRVEFYNSNHPAGVINNFNHGLEKTTADYILFSDQDDVWLNDKVELLLNKIQKAESNCNEPTPCLVFSNLCVVDEKLNVIGSDFYVLNGLNPLNNLDERYLIWRSTIYGCTTIFNRALLSKAGLAPCNITMHDHWFAYNALKFGMLIYDERKYVLYRQHSGNLVGSHKRNIFSKLSRIRKTMSGINKNIATVRFWEHEKKMAEHKFTLFNNVIPFIRERTLYTVLFIILWSIK